jgi:glycerol-3-phosphate acyltransferase PlsY
VHESILTHAKSRYLWMAIALCVISIALYVWHDPGVAPTGGTWLGYTLGTVAALLIVWLMLFGIRKRSYSTTLGSTRGWLSAHIYLGTALILLALLHCGFQFGWNLHTFALVLMLIVIFSGFFGVYAYLRYPTLMTRNRESATRDAMLEEILEIDQNALALADGIAPEIHAVVLRSIENTRLGGGVWTQLRARDGSDIAIAKVRAAIAQRDTQNGVSSTPQAGQTIIAMVDFLAGRADDKQTEALRKLIDMLSRKKGLATRVARDIQYQAVMEIWLYIHVPLSITLLAALIGHIVSVFFYW